MPVSKKRKKPEKKQRRRDDEAPASTGQAAAAAPPERSGGGLLSRMRGGFQNMAGSGPKKPESLLSKIVTWALVAAVAYFVAKRFGIIR